MEYLMDNVPNTFSSLFMAYTVVWLILGGYIFSLVFRLRRLEAADKEHRSENNND